MIFFLKTPDEDQEVSQFLERGTITLEENKTQENHEIAKEW